MTQQELKHRTKQFALRAIYLSEALPQTRTGNVIANQLLRSGTSVGANYRSACRARSTKDFINKLGVVIEEGDESGYWIELIVEAKLMSEKRVAALLKESNELVAIFTASHKTAKARMRRTNQKSAIGNQK
ncbi:MAG: four helix bundle protein [Chloroflexi bacterium]|nr:four helix bundle protein [Chloroflexota bacterium]